jgi:maleamate amidohydrolase
MADAYGQVGYGSSQIGWGERAAILVVDWQEAFTTPKYALGGLDRLHKARDNTAKLLVEARARGVPVAACYTAYCSNKDMPFWKVKAVRDEFFYGPAPGWTRRSITRRTSPTARTHPRCSSRRR